MTIANLPAVDSQKMVVVFKDGRWVKAEKQSVDPWLVQRMLITPEWASEVLHHRNHENRDEKPGYQEKLIRALTAGRFFLTNQGVGFYEDGNLADGQNRLAAIVKSGKAANMVVVFGIDPEAKVAIDDGIKRSDIDIARLSGDRELPNRAVMIGNSLLAMMRNKLRIPDKFEKQAFYERYMEGLMWTHTIFQPIKRRGVTQMAVLAAVTRAYYNFKDNAVQLNRLKQFVKILGDGEGTGPSDRAAIKLRNTLLDIIDESGKSKSKTTETGYNREEIFRKSERAIRSFMNGEAIEKLYEARTELFPLPDEQDFYAEELRANKSPVIAQVGVETT